MSSFYLHSEIINPTNYIDFVKGCYNLILINRNEEHIFYKNSDVYNLIHIRNTLYKDLNSVNNRLIYEFLEKLSTCEENVNCEITAQNHCGSDINGFLGFTFSTVNYPYQKKISNQENYDDWILFYKNNFETILHMFGPNLYAKRFLKDFGNLSVLGQQSVITYLQKAINRKLISKFYPDTKIISDVSISNKTSVYELRIYTPVAIRLYFCEENDIIYLASIESKSNPNQNQDIKTAEKIILNLKKL